MIGRAASYNPWIFAQISEYLATGTYAVPTDDERYRMMKTYYLMLQSAGEKDMIGKMKQFATYFTHGIRNGSKLRTEIYRAQTAEDILTLVDAFFEHQLREPDALAPVCMSAAPEMDCATC
jgi:tRNA-dihydrouridine synthase